MSPAHPRPTRSVSRLATSVLVIALAAPLAAPAQDIGLRIDALAQEAALLREELSRLDAVGGPLAQEGQQLDAADAALRAEANALDEAVQRYNTAMKQVEQDVAAHNARCPRESEDAALVESCNAQAARIRAEAKRLDALRPQLQQQQSALNARVETHNAQRRQWAAHRHVHDSKVSLNRRDLDDFLRRVQTVLGSADFRAASSRKGNPSACAQDALRDLDARPASLALDAVERCLQAVKTGA